METLTYTQPQIEQAVVTSTSGGEGGVREHDTDLLVGVVTLARMVKLLLTVRRLANTWGMDGQRRRERRRREEEGAGGSGGGGGGGQVHCTNSTDTS